MRRVKRLKEAIARLERETGATEAQLEEEFEHGYAAGFNAGRVEMDTKLRDLIADISLQAAFTGKDVEDLPAHVAGLRGRAGNDNTYYHRVELPPELLEFKRRLGLEEGRS